MAGRAEVGDLSLVDLLLLVLYSPVVEHGFPFNDGVDEVAAGADVLESALNGGALGSRRDVTRQVRAGSDGRRNAGIDRLVRLGLATPPGDPEFIVKLPGSKPRGIAREGALVFSDPDLGDTVRAEVIGAIDGSGDGRMLCLGLLVDAGPWVKSRVAPGPEHAERRKRVTRIRKGKDESPLLTSFAASRGIAAGDVRTVVDGTRVAVRSAIGLP
jgi:hypothetical protein